MSAKTLHLTNCCYALERSTGGIYGYVWCTSGGGCVDAIATSETHPTEQEARADLFRFLQAHFRTDAERIAFQNGDVLGGRDR